MSPVSLYKRVDDRNIPNIKCIHNIPVKLERIHGFKFAPTGASKRTREVVYQAKNIIRKLHVIKNICINEPNQFLLYLIRTIGSKKRPCPKI
jgi:hypothetical protein